MKDALATLLPPVLFAGVGNTLKGDDGAGPEAARRIAAAVPDALVIDCGMIPENYLREMKSRNAHSIVFIDAVEMGGEPGEVRLFRADEVASTGASTHGMSLAMLAEYIGNETNAAVYLLGIQPRSMNLGEQLSPEVEKSVSDLVQLVKRMSSHA